MRHADWQSRLTNLIQGRRNSPYDIVEFNCLRWACEGIEACRDDDYYSIFDNEFSNEIGAAKILRQIGKAESCEEYLSAILGEKVPLGLVRKGDLVKASPNLDIPGNKDLFGTPFGVCYGQLSYFVGETELVSIETLALGTDSYGFYC